MPVLRRPPRKRPSSSMPAAEVERVDVLEHDDVALHAHDLADVRDPPGAVPQTGQLDDHVERGGHLLPDDAHRQVHARHQRQGLDAGERVPWRVGVDGGDRAVVTGVHGLEHVERFSATDLTDDDAVGSHTQRVAHEVADLDLALALDVGRARFHREHMVLVELELLGVLDGDDALVSRDEARQHVEQGRLPGAGTAADDDVEAALHALVDEVRDLGRERPEADEVVDGVRVLRELSDGHERPADRQRVHDHVHTGTIGEAGVDHGVRLVDASADLADDLVDDPPEVRLVDELHVGERELAAALHVDHLGAVHHDFSDGVVPEQLVDRAVAEHVVGDRLHQYLALGDRRARSAPGSAPGATARRPGDAAPPPTRAGR